MKQWLLAAVVLALVGGFVAWQRDSVRISYVNGLAEYSHLPGREYIFQRDCYIFTFKDRSTTWPLVGAHATVPELPATVDPRQVGADLPGVRILDTVRIGDRFRIVSVRREESRRGTHISFELLFENEADRKYARIDAYHILDHTPELKGRAPTILGDYAAPKLAGAKGR